MDSSRVATSSHARGRSRPVGISLICVLGVFISILLFLASFRLLGAGETETAFGLLYQFLALAYLIVVYGLWTGQLWGWIAGLLVFAVDAVLDIVQAELGGLLISLVFIAYLYSTRAYYHSPEPAAGAGTSAE